MLMIIALQASNEMQLERHDDDDSVQSWISMFGCHQPDLESSLWCGLLTLPVSHAHKLSRHFFSNQAWAQASSSAMHAASVLQVSDSVKRLRVSFGHAHEFKLHASKRVGENRDHTPHMWLLADLVNVFEVFLPQLLLYPNPTDPLNGEAAALMLRAPDQYRSKIQGASVPPATDSEWLCQKRRSRSVAHTIPLVPDSLSVEHLLTLLNQIDFDGCGHDSADIRSAVESTDFFQAPAECRNLRGCRLCETICTRAPTASHEPAPTAACFGWLSRARCQGSKDWATLNQPSTAREGRRPSRG